MAKLSDCINSSDSLHEYLFDKGRNHNNYKFYTANEKIIKNILETHSLYLSDGSTWNDSVDKTSFNPDDDSRHKRYALCFSHMKHENVAMWMLYGKNAGYMMDLGKNIIGDCLNCLQVECGRICDGKFKCTKTLTKPFFSVEILDVLYYGTPKDNDISSFYVKRGDEVYQNFPADIINNLRFCKKTVPWLYECESRLIVTIGKDIKEVEECDTIKVPFKTERINELKEKIYHSPNFKEQSKYKRSKLSGKIEWDIIAQKGE